MAVLTQPASGRSRWGVGKNRPAGASRICVHSCGRHRVVERRANAESELGLVLRRAFLQRPKPASAGGRDERAVMTEIAQPIRMQPAIRKVAAGRSDVTTIALDSITSVEEHKAGRLKGWRLAVSTSPEIEYTFRVKPGQWPSDLANALAARPRRSGHARRPGHPVAVGIVRRRG